MLPGTKDSLTRLNLSRAEFFVLLILLFGLPMIVLVPPGAGYDEEDHLVRVWEISGGSFVPGRLPPGELRYPTVFRDAAYRQQGSTGVITPDFWQSYGQAGLYERGFVRREIDTKSVYSPALLVPQALAMRLFGRGLGLPALLTFYLCRLAGWLGYLVLISLAVRLLPSGKWILGVLAASPMALFQAATLTPDTLSNGIGFLFVAGCLHLAGLQKIGGRETAVLLVLILLLFLAKLNLVPLVLLPFLLIRPSALPSRRAYAVLLLASAALFFLEVVGWNWIASRDLGSVLLDEADPGAQLMFIAGHPLAFLQTVIRDALAHGWLYARGWINGYGYYYWTPPLLVSILYLLALGVVTYSDAPSGPENRKRRGVLFLVFVAGFLATITSLYLSFAPVGAGRVFGVQGRYFIPLALPLFLGISSWLSGSRIPAAPGHGTRILLLLALSLNLAGLFLSFHVPCGSTFYRPDLCYHPLFRDDPGILRASVPLSNKTSVVQEIQVRCSGLAEVRLPARPSTPGDPGITRFVLEDMSSGKALLDRSLENRQVQGTDWQALPFEPDGASAGKRYRLRITASGVTPGQGLSFLYTEQPEFNLGDSYENGRLLEEDLILQYGCATGLRKLWPAGQP